MLVNIFCIIVTLITWEIAVKVFAISPYVFPPPTMVAKALIDLSLSGILFQHVAASLYRVTWGYFIAVAIGIPLGFILGTNPPLKKLLNPLIQFLRPISPLAWIPLALLWFGIGDLPAIFLIFLSVFFPVTVFTMSGVSRIKITYLQVASNFGLKGPRLFFHVIFPAALPEIVTGLRIAMGTAWLVIVAAEMIAVKSGLGYLIIDARNGLKMDEVVAGMIVIGIIGLMLDYLMKRLDRLPEVQWSKMRR